MVVTKIVSGWSPDLFENFQTINELGHSFTITEPSSVIVTGHIDCEHRAIAGTSGKAVMVAFNAMLNGIWIPGAKTGMNIYDLTDHYGICPIAFSFDVEPGNHTVTIFGRSASTAAPGVNGLAEIKDGYNCVTYNILPRT
jgi:hypothetical protein